MSIRLDNRVAIVTGAGAGLGRAHALLLGRLGAKVVVNDPGGAVSGTGADTSVAEQVAAEIRAAGGEAVAETSSVSTPEGARAIVAKAVDSFGRLDILVNNAGILRDKSFAKMELQDFEDVVDVHFLGTVYCTKAAWNVMREQNYGRIVMTTSAAGITGGFGQANYGAAKMAVLGFMNCLALEGAKSGVLVNAISPSAATRMTEKLVRPALGKLLRPDLVSPAVAWLASEACQENGIIVWALAGYFSRVAFMETKGRQFDPTKPVTVDMVADAWREISDLATAAPLPPGPLGHLEGRLKEMGLLES